MREETTKTTARAERYRALGRALAFASLAACGPSGGKAKPDAPATETARAPSASAVAKSAPTDTASAAPKEKEEGAPSVHVWYTVPKDTEVAAFYNEVTAIEDPPSTYYMATGFSRGYFGMQVNSPTERRIIFSVWNAGHEKTDPKKVAAEDKVALVSKGDGVEVHDFGHEGTGGHSHFVFPWKTGETQRFFVTAKLTDATHTTYSGFYYRPDQKKWMLIASFNAPKDGKWLKGLYSFNEDFGRSGSHRRKARFGNEWIKTPEGKWIELLTGSFTHTGDKRKDRCMGVEEGQFFLANGGFVEGCTTESGEKFTRPAVGKGPSDLPEIPQ